MKDYLSYSSTSDFHLTHEFLHRRSYLQPFVYERMLQLIEFKYVPVILLDYFRVGRILGYCQSILRTLVLLVIPITNKIHVNDLFSVY